MTDNRNRAVVTGLGIITANALGREEFFKAITDAKTGLRDIEMFSNLGTRTSIAGGVDMSFPDMQNAEDEEKTVLMAYKVLDEAFEDSGLTRQDISDLGVKAGISFATSNGGNLRIMKHVKTNSEQIGNSPDWLIGMTSFTNLVSRHAGVKGPAYTTASACAAGTGGAGIALDVIRSGKTELMVVVGSDPLTECSAAGFHSLKSMSVNGCKPFDMERDGMSIGEGAVAMIVESLDRALKRNAHIYAEILGYGIGNDAHHMTSPDPDGLGAYRTIMMALEDGATSKQEIEYINTHGTGTELNDVMEINAISRVYNDIEERQEVLISSTKSMTGHCLGAAGSVELAVILLAVDRGVVPPTVGLENPAEGFKDFNLVKDKSVKKKIKKAMSNSFAFAGHSASIIVGKYDGES